MRKWNLTLAARIVAGALCMIFAMGTILGVGGVVALFQSNAFNDGGKELFDDACWYLMSRDITTVQQQLEGSEALRWNMNEGTDSIDPLPNGPWELAVPIHLQSDRTNFRFDAGNKDVFITNGDPTGCLAYREESWTLYLSREDDRHMAEVYPTEEEAYQALDRIHEQGSWLLTSSITETDNGWMLEARYQPRAKLTVTARYGIDGSFPVVDRYSILLPLVNTFIVCRNWVIPVTAACLVLTIATFIFLLISAGHRTGTAEVSRNWFDKLPLELVLLAMVALLGVGMKLFTDWAVTVLLLFLPMLLALGLLLCMTFAVRCKTGTLVKGTILYWVCHWAWAAVKWLWYVLKNLPLIWKTALIWAGISLVELIMLAGYGSGPVSIFWLLEKLIVTPILFAFVIGLKKLQDGARRMAAGDMTPVPEKFLFPEEKKHAQSLNSMGRGAVLAAEQRLKSERMKTELITNVSHDIKTPLTSLISYVDLLKKEGLSSEHAPEYVAVLDRQSQRLKKLTEDLVEASKASTGNMTVTKEDTDVNLLLSQAAGEYAERLAAAQLTLVTTLTPAEPHIQADGRLLWRAFDNLLSNVCKYAQPGTRVYLSTEVKEGKTQIAFRNVSREPLNISADELMERFVRGDASRNTEGSGLGLSIARSLTELNGGTLELTVDGDLFKATLIF